MPSVQRINQALLESAAQRLVTVPPQDRVLAARQLIRNAPAHNIDLSLIWGVVNDDTQVVEQSCLLVPAAGRTGMLYLSAPNETYPETTEQQASRVSILKTVFDAVDAELRDRIRLTQTLAGVDEDWATRACRRANMTEIGHLAYLKRAIARRESEPPSLPDGVRLRPVGDLNAESDRELLALALERSYIDTLDCPGLCDLRDIDDVIDSHQATGEYNPALWWIIEAENEPHGALLLARYPDQSVMELVYLGLSPTLRGRGIGRRMMDFGLHKTSKAGVSEMTCAVDTRNVYAMQLYKHLGFKQFDVRLALVRPTA